MLELFYIYLLPLLPLSVFFVRAVSLLHSLVVSLWRPLCVGLLYCCSGLAISPSSHLVTVTRTTTSQASVARICYYTHHTLSILTMHHTHHALYSPSTIPAIQYTQHPLYSPCTVLTMHYARHKLCSRRTILTMKYTDHVLCSPPCKSTMSPAEKLSKKMRKFFWQTTVRRR